MGIKALAFKVLAQSQAVPKGVPGENVVGTPEAPCESERRFRQPHARLFPFIGRKVRTPAGPGILQQVFADRATVVLESELTKCTTVFHPSQIEPASEELT